MTRKRTRVVGLAATLASVPFFLPTAAGANVGPGYVDSSNDPASYPPLPGECAGHLPGHNRIGILDLVSLETELLHF